MLLTKTTAVQNEATLSARAVFSGSCFCGDYSDTDTLMWYTFKSRMKIVCIGLTIYYYWSGKTEYSRTNSS